MIGKNPVRVDPGMIRELRSASRLIVVQQRDSGPEQTTSVTKSKNYSISYELI